MAKKRITIEVGSGSVFADLGFADAKELSLKVELAMEVNRLLRERGLTQAGSAKALGILQPHVSDLVRYRLDRFSVERLMNFLTGLGHEAFDRHGGVVEVAHCPGRVRRVALHPWEIFWKSSLPHGASAPRNGGDCCCPLLRACARRGARCRRRAASRPRKCNPGSRRMSAISPRTAAGREYFSGFERAARR